MDNRFCVVNLAPCNSPMSIKRTWLPTREKAEAHAQRLIAGQVTKGNRPQPLAVMECVSVVGPVTPRFEVTPADQYDASILPIDGED
jgi:hypothetical protein